LWGIDRYKAEYIVPFVVLGIHLVFSKLISLNLPIPPVPSVAIAVIFAGVLEFRDYHDSFRVPHASDRFPRETEIIYDYKSSLVAVKDMGLSDKSILIGANYGVFPHILADYTIGEVKGALAIHNRKPNYERSGVVNASLLNCDTQVQATLLPQGKFSSLKADLDKLGWQQLGQARDMDSKQILILVRGQSNQSSLHDCLAPIGSSVK